MDSDLLVLMKRIRFVEEEIARRYSENEMRCPVHLSVGQEAVAAGVGQALGPRDLAVSGHRAHAHYLGMGGNLNALIAELYGKASGCSSGKGGSMHLVDEAAGFMGSTAIVGGTIPIGVGLALGMKSKQTDQLACIFLGDAAVETGVFFESLNFAVLKKLPVLFICENNLYSVYTPIAARQPAGRQIHEMVSGLGIAASCHDGNDALATYDTVIEAAKSIRRGDGPRFIEFATYRWLEHCGPNLDNDIGYRTEDEFLKWKARDPVQTLEGKLRRAGTIGDAWIDETNRRIKEEVEAAFHAARLAPFPAANEAYKDLFAEC
jgi:TPP-dependent pyruvate/acetoin dehydrogenase alpha subunit